MRVLVGRPWAINCYFICSHICHGSSERGFAIDFTSSSYISLPSVLLTVNVGWVGIFSIGHFLGEQNEDYLITTDTCHFVFSTFLNEIHLAPVHEGRFDEENCQVSSADHLRNECQNMALFEWSFRNPMFISGNNKPFSSLVILWSLPIPWGEEERAGKWESNPHPKILNPSLLTTILLRRHAQPWLGTLYKSKSLGKMTTRIRTIPC